MKPTIFWKRIDLAGQLLMLLPLIFIAAPTTRGYCFGAYFSVGAWQAISCLLNAMLYSGPAGRDRRNYGRLLSVVCGTAILALGLQWAGSSDQENRLLQTLDGLGSVIGGAECLIMLVLGPVMAIRYMCITQQEIMALRHREQVHWKL